MSQKEGLYGKYIIRNASGEPLDPNAKYIVLRYDAESKDGPAARHALIAYARFISQSNIQFSKDLIEEMKKEWDKFYLKQSNEE